MQGFQKPAILLIPAQTRVRAPVPGPGRTVRQCSVKRNLIGSKEPAVFSSARESRLRRVKTLYISWQVLCLFCLSIPRVVQQLDVGQHHQSDQRGQATGGVFRSSDRPTGYGPARWPETEVNRKQSELIVPIGCPNWVDLALRHKQNPGILVWLDTLDLSFQWPDACPRRRRGERYHRFELRRHRCGWMAKPRHLLKPVKQRPTGSHLVLYSHENLSSQ